MRNYKDKNGFSYYVIDEEGFITNRRNLPNYWLKLPRDIIIVILQKVGVLESLRSAQLVCTQWREICTDPSTWVTTSMVDWFSYWNPHLNLISDDCITHVENIDLDISWPVNWFSCWTPQLNLTPDEYRTHLENIISREVDQSCGSLFNLDLDKLIMSKEELHYAVERSSWIRRLLGVPRCFIQEILGRVASRLPLLENFELIGICSTFSTDAIETLGRYCPNLSSLKINIYGDEEAKIIARSMPQLRHICFPGENLMTDVGVEALLDGCPHLESLDIRKCYFFKITRAFQMMENLPLTRTQWRDVIKDSSIWSTICAGRWMFGYKSFLSHEEFKFIIRRVVDKSFGRLVYLDLDRYMSGDILSYVVKRCTQVRRIHGKPLICSEEEIRAAFTKLPLLEDLAHYYDSCFRVPLNGCYGLTNLGVKILLDGCPHLKCLDLFNCQTVGLCETVLRRLLFLQKPFALDQPCCCWTCYRSSRPRYEDDFDYSQLFEEDVYGVDFTIHRREEYWSRREKARGRETRRIQQRRSVKGNKKRLNSDKKRDQKVRRRRDIETDSRREIKKEIVHWNKIAADPYKIMI